MSQRAKVSAVVCLAAFMAGLDLFIVNLAFPRIGREFQGTSLATLSWVLNAYAIVYAALLVPAGRFADRTGRRRSFLVGLALFTLSSAVCAAAQSVAVLIAGRVAHAVGAGLLIPSSLGLLLPEFPAERRQLAVGLWASAASAAAAAGPPLGGLLTEVGWRLVFLVNVPVGAAAVFAGVLVLRETRDAGGPRPDVLGGGLLAGCVGALALAIVQGPTWGWRSIPVLALLGAAAGCGLLLARRSFRHPAPVIENALLRARPFALASLATLLFFLGFGTFLLCTVVFLTGIWHEDALTAGLMLAAAPAAATVVSVRSPSVVRWLGQARAGALGALLVAAGTGWYLARVGTAPNFATDLLPGQLVGGAGVGLVIPSLTGAAAMALPPDRFATGTAIVSMARQIGMALGVAALVAVFAMTSQGVDMTAVRRGWALVVVAAAASSLAALSIGRRASSAVPGPDAVGAET
jgi:EmrB/QacA subfamily drug resistance transporter